jgi:hypothetical protein
MSDENQLANTKAALAQARGRMKQWRAMLKVDSFDDIEPRLKQLIEASDQVETMSAELTTLKSQSGKPDDKDKTIQELTGQLRQRDFRDAFRAEATKAGVKSEMVDKLLKLSDLTPPSEGEIKPESFAEYLAAAKTSDGWAFGETPSAGASVNGTSQSNGQAVSQPPPGAGRSASAPSVGQVRYSNADINQAGWQKSRPELVQALKAGTAVLTD